MKLVINNDSRAPESLPQSCADTPSASVRGLGLRLFVSTCLLGDVQAVALRYPGLCYPESHTQASLAWRALQVVVT